MTAPHKVGPTRKCLRCGLPKSAHVIDDRCADGKAFRATTRALAASQSFNPDEVQVLKALCTNALKGYDSRNLARQPAFRKLYSKTLTMEKRCETVAALNAAAKAASQG